MLSSVDAAVNVAADDVEDVESVTASPIDSCSGDHLLLSLFTFYGHRLWLSGGSIGTRWRRIEDHLAILGWGATKGHWTAH